MSKPAKPYQCPIELYAKLEAEAARKRKATGKMIRWTDILRKILEQYFKISP
jgi:hypothetical protein